LITTERGNYIALLEMKIATLLVDGSQRRAHDRVSPELLEALKDSMDVLMRLATRYPR
jgi:hypothetical protein